MIFRNLSLLLVIMFVLGCNDSGSETQATTDGQQNPQSQDTGGSDSADLSKPERVGKLVARVNGVPIYEDELKGRNIEFVVSEEIIYQAGVKKGMEKQFREKVRQFEKTLVVKAAKSEVMENREPTKKVSDEQIERYYELNKNKYVYPRVLEISFPDVNMGNEIKERAEKGEDLQDIASSNPDVAMTVTNLGFNKRMAKNFDSIEVDQVSDVIQKPNGTFSVLKIVEVKDIPLSVSKKSIRNILEAKEKGKMFGQYADELAKENNITVEIIQ